MRWHNEYISWDPNQFCGIDNVSLPAEVLWIPDINIEEMYCLVIIPIESEDSAVTCRYRNILNYLNLTQNKELYSMVRPGDTRNYTEVFLYMSIQGILDVREIDQTLVSYIWIFMRWTDPDIYWNPDEFCGRKYLIVPADLLWKPDLMIEEMREKDKAPPSPYVTLHSNGDVIVDNYLTVVSTCKIQVYKFPFDVQSCNLSFKSIVYPDEDITFDVIRNNTLLTKLSLEDMGTQYEWLFLNLTVNSSNLTNPEGFTQSRIVYTVTVFCIGMFGLMMISLLETILVMYLIDRDSASEENQADKGLSKDCGDKQGNYDDVKKWTHCACVCNVSDEPPSELLSVGKEDKRSQLMEESNSLEKLPDDLSEAVKTLSLLLSRKEERKPDYWTRVARKLDIIFFFVYVTVSALFLVVIFSLWIYAKDE
ncbi:5-hydroxytryptamine receptor 3A [Dissostichus eleginoides]|uniref:5-hydroxytryptamine receptor 3A n=1 Tax=Dissostichus eleginoides TaxID=100907 RepID=A0AAD9EXU2_DISEL|nr:5-hydroxytryptamine receptor 3A [Dissostichus eleginoides]